MKYEEEVVTVNCPFCGEEIVRAYDHSMIDDDDEEEDDDQTEEEICYKVDETDGCCEHLAFRSDWAYSGSEFIPKWEQQMKKLAAAVSGDDDINTPDVIADAIHVDNENLHPYAAEVLPEFHFEYDSTYVEKFDGVSSGGPTYMHIFLKEKQ